MGRKGTRKRGGIFGRIFKRNAYDRYYNSERSEEKKGVLRIFDQFSNLSPETKKTILSIIFFTFAILLLLSLFGVAGVAGAQVNYYMTLLLGMGKWYLPIILAYLGYLLVRPANAEMTGVRSFGALLFFISLNNFIHLIQY